MKAIILAAGIGKRLLSVSQGLPKSMINIGKTSILHKQINCCLENGINDFVFVLGYKKEQMKDHILKILPESKFKIVINDRFTETNTLYSLWLTRDHFNDDFIYFNADVIFGNELLEKIVKKSEFSQLLLETKKCGAEEVKIIIDDDDTILKIGKQLPLNKCAGEFIGIGKFNKDVLSTFSKCLQFGIENHQENNYFEYAVNLLAKEQILKAISTENIPCIEIDFPEDLKKAQQMFSL